MKILGLDLGVASIGWALIDIDADNNSLNELTGLGSRIVNLSQDDTNSFYSTSKPTSNAQRTFKRTARKMNQRHKQRRKALQNRLYALGMFDRNNPLNTLSPLELWRLRAEAADPHHKLEKAELGRVILHLSSKRGYQHSRKSSDSESKDSKFVAAINQRYAELIASGQTMGQMFYERLKNSARTGCDDNGSPVSYRIKEGDPEKSNLLPRKAHEDELMQILKAQQTHYPDLLSDKVIAEIFHIIFYQRPLKSCKGLVNRCEMFDFRFTNSRGKEVSGSPRVAPRTSPIAQLTRIWESVNNLRLVNISNKAINPGDRPEAAGKSKDYRKSRNYFELTAEEKRMVVNYLNTHPKLTATTLLKLLGLSRSDGFKPETNISSGIKGNQTVLALYEALEGYPGRDDLLKFKPEVTELVDTESGQIRLVVDSAIVNEPLYRLWHLIYSIPDEIDLKDALTEQFGIDDEDVLNRLAALDFTTAGFSNRSVKFMRRILPYLMEGDIYSVACEKAGFRHSDYLTSEENASRSLASELPIIEKGILRQPLVEKVLNQMVHLVNDIIDSFGPIDEIRVELARELRQSKEERIKAEIDIAANEKTNLAHAKKIEELGLKANRRTIQKYRLWEETGHLCIYCGSPINVVAFLSGEMSEVEHIIPRSLFFDDSMSNKTCSCSLCNRTKGKNTAYDFMLSKGSEAFLDFQHRVEELADKKKISRKKLKYFLTPAAEIPDDFIERDLQQTRYITRKAMEMLRGVAREVYASSGRVTDFFRNAWGYNRMLETLNINRYRPTGLVVEEGSRTYIKEWTKRIDHRHHAVDALTIALTRQGYVQRLNTLHSSRGDMHGEVGKDYDSALSLLEQWAIGRPHFAPAQVMTKLEEIGVSFKPGKKASSGGRGGVKVPRGPLHEETVYGRIWVPDGELPIEKLLKDPELIANPHHRKAVKGLLAQFGGDVKSVKKYIKKSPSGVLSPEARLKTRRREYIKREAVASLNASKIEKIVDPVLKQLVKERLEECGSENAFRQSFAGRPIFMPGTEIPIKRVTVTTGLKDKSMVAVKHSDGCAIGFAKTGNNHHAAFYITPQGEIKEYVTSLWIAVKRCNLGLPAIITDPASAWERIRQIAGSRDADEVAASLPPSDARLLLTLSRNEMVVLGLSDEQLREAVESKSMSTLASHLYRVAIISPSFYVFLHHTYTQSVKDKIAAQSGNYVLLASWDAFTRQNIVKVRIDRLGRIMISDNG